MQMYHILKIRTFTIFKILAIQFLEYYSNLIDFTGLIFEMITEGIINISKHSNSVPTFNKNI